MKRALLVLLVITGLGGLTAQVMARPGFGAAHMDPLEKIERITAHLGLSAEQEQEITAIINAAEVDTAVDKQRLEQLREEMHAQAESFDAGTAQSLADELGQITARLVFTKTSSMAQVRALLTAEQLAQMQQMRERHHAMRARWGEEKQGRGRRSE